MGRAPSHESGADFRERSFVDGFPPKIIWLDVGNAGTPAIAGLLRRKRRHVERFEIRDESAFLILSLGPTGF
jgi:predicted nuclease of predicted toxin-antitoxin system